MMVLVAFGENSLLFDNKIIMPEKTGMKQKENPVGCSGEGKR